jgi:hypothetical protein
VTNRDRTAQLTTIAQVLLDPFYRTAEGFLVLIHKEWSCFGHKFEDRSGRSGRSKETSAIFIQMLDCVYQLILQYPQHFEFNSNYLLYLVQCFYAGFFTSFRGNNERDRFLVMRREACFEDMTMDDLDFGHLSVYMNMLLRTSSTVMGMINVNYCPPKPNEKQVLYIRPKFNPGDIDLWREGIFGLNSNALELASQGFSRVTAAEGVSVTNNMLARYMSYVDTHLWQLHSSTREKLEIVKSTHYPCPAFPEGFYNSNNVLSNIFQSYNKTIVRSLGNSSSWFAKQNKELTDSDRAAARIQLWYRAYNITKSAIIEQGRAPPEYYSISAYQSGLYKTMSKLDRRRFKASHRIFMIICSSYLKEKFAIKCELSKGREATFKVYVDEIVEDIIDRGLRLELALRNVTLQQQLMEQAVLPKAVDVNDDPKKKSLSARLLKAAGDNMSFLKITTTEDEGAESGDVEDSNSTKHRSASTSSYSSFMRSFYGSSK